MTDLHIEWVNEGGGKGQMTIHCDNFFPCSQSTLKKLLKVVDMDFQHQDDLLNNMMSYLKQAEVLKRKEKDEIKGVFQKEYEKMCSLQHLIQDGRFPNGLPLKKDDRKTKKEELKEQKKVVNDLQQKFKQADRDMKKLHSNQQTMKDVYGGSWE